jgi:hypothetical protein
LSINWYSITDNRNHDTYIFRRKNGLSHDLFLRCFRDIGFSDFIHRPGIKKQTKEIHDVSETGPVISKGPNRIGFFPHLRTETDPVSETSCFSLVCFLIPG